MRRVMSSQAKSGWVKAKQGRAGWKGPGYMDRAVGVDAEANEMEIEV